jgi:thioredoxin-related protein
MAWLRVFAVILLALVPAGARAETVLLMAEETGCVWCARWDAEISAIYPKTPEGRAAPLQRFDIHGQAPEGVAFKSRVRFTPTFVLVRDGLEIDRIEGYPGEDFFWGLLGLMLEQANVPHEETG